MEFTQIDLIERQRIHFTLVTQHNSLTVCFLNKVEQTIDQRIFCTIEIFINTIDNHYILCFVVRNVIYHIIVMADKSMGCRWQSTGQVEGLTKIFSYLYPFGKAGGFQIPRCQGIAVKDYGLTLGVLALKPSRFHNIGENTNGQKIMSKEEGWNRYLQEEKLDNYPEILQFFDSGSEAIKLVKQALLDDRILRPVFMQVLPEEKTGKMEICNKTLAEEKINGEKTLSDYIFENKGIFLCGKPKVANEILTNGGKIIVAVTDRHYDKAQFSVANLRQCYIPLPDKRFLTFKSSGLFHDPVSKPHNKLAVKFTGIGDRLDKDIALTSFERLGPFSEGFIDFLAYQPLYSLPDGKGKFEDAEYEKNGIKTLPYLIVNCAISPHRLSKIPQLDDQGLFRLRKRISPLLKDRAIKRQRSGRKLMPALEFFFTSGEDVIALEGYFQFLAEEIGIGTARKQNNQLFHVTFHEQDVNLGGQICDREEMHTFESYFKRNKIKYVDPFFEIIKKSHIGIRDVVSAVGVIKFLYKNKRECKDNKVELLESFFRAYFRRLSYTYFKRWESLIDTLDNVIIFYFDHDDVLGKDGLKKVREWYRAEKAGRKIEFTGL